MIDVNGYLLVTAAKNEGENLPKLIQSVVEQTTRPRVWVIVDDGSTDNTPQVLKEAKEKYEWIQIVRLESRVESRDIGFHLSSVMKEAFDFAVQYCKKKGIDYEYLGNVDGDMILEQNFFEELLKEFEKNPKLGIAGGGVYLIENDRIIHVPQNTNEPSGGIMLIKKKCYEACDGIQLTCCWDSVLKAKARLRGWETMRFEYIKALETRVPGSENYWKRGFHGGKSAYYLNVHPINVLARSINFCKRSYRRGIAYMLGYVFSFLLRREKIHDEELREYFWNKWRKEV